VLASILVATAALVLLWSVGSVVLRALAWFLVAVMAISLVAGIAVPPGAVVASVACWAGGHSIYRLRHGHWRSHLLAGLAGHGDTARG
jgi:hypothetical protein